MRTISLLRTVGCDAQRRRLWGGTLALLAFVLGGVAQSRSIEATSDDDPRKSQVEAALIFNFAKFVSWPHEDGAPLDLCLSHTDKENPAIQSLDGRQVRGRTIIVRGVVRPKDYYRCEIVIVHDPSVPSTAGTLRGVLFIGDMPGFARRGGTLELVERAGRMRFRVNMLSARRAEIGVSSKLLQLADHVIN